MAQVDIALPTFGRPGGFQHVDSNSFVWVVRYIVEPDVRLLLLAGDHETAQLLIERTIQSLIETSNRVAIAHLGDGIFVEITFPQSDQSNKE